MNFSVICKVGLRRAGARSVVAMAVFAALGAPASRAQQAPPDQHAPHDSPFKSVLKIVGLATDVAPPPNFVQQSRPPAPLPLIPVFAKPPEPPGNAQTAKEVEGIDSDLEAISKRDDALRAAFPPSAKAVADVAAAKAAKDKNKAKTAKKSPIPSF